MLMKQSLILLLLLGITISKPRKTKTPQKKARILSEFRNKTVTEGESVTFKCQAWGYPKPDVVIVRGRGNGGLKLPPLLAGGGYSKAVMVIESVSQDDVGMVKCLALNHKNLAKKVAYLNVRRACSGSCQPPKVCVDGVCQCSHSCDLTSAKLLCASNCKQYYNECSMERAGCNENVNLTVWRTGFCPEIVGPSIIPRKERYTITPGGSVKLDVTVEGSPTPHVEWFWREEGTDLYKKVGDNVDLVTDMPGEYYAVARNCLSNVVKSQGILVEAAPSEPPTTLPTTIVFGSTFETTNMAYFSGEKTTVTPDTENVTDNDFDNLSKDTDKKVCSAVGANILTFDGMTYGFRSTCTFVMAMDCFLGTWFVYIRFRPCLDNPFINCFESVQITANGQQFQLLRGWTINNNGFRLPYEKGKPFQVQGMTGFFDGYYLTITLPHSNVRVLFDGFSVVHVVTDSKTETCGICGDNDGDYDNDIQNGRPRYQTANELGNFLDSWMLRNKAHCGEGETEIVDRSEEALVCPSRMADVRKCDSLRKVKTFKSCLAANHLEFLYNVCRYETCSGEAQLKDFPLTCAIGHAIASTCNSTPTKSWEEAVMCKPDKDRVNAVKNWP